MLEEKFDAVVALLMQHNEAMESKEDQVDPNRFIRSLKALGGTTEERLRKLSYEDLLSLFPNNSAGIKPILLAKDIAAIFRDKETSNKIEDRKVYISPKKADRMTLRELLENLDVDDLDSAIAKRLQSVSAGKPFIVYQKGTKNINIDESLKLLQELKNYEPRTVVTLNGEVYKVHALSDVPNSYVDENPFYPGRPLRPDGTCDQLNRSWEGVDLEVRQFIRVACDMKEIDVSGKSGRDKMHDLLDEALKDNSSSWFRQRYPKVAIKFDSLKEVGNLPSLKVQLGQKELPVSGNPFECGQKVEINRQLSVTKKTISPMTPHNSWKYSSTTHRWYDVNKYNQ
jgi:hypothetical protein